MYTVVVPATNDHKIAPSRLQPSRANCALRFTPLYFTSHRSIGRVLAT